jgi:hypothetical protein
VGDDESEVGMDRVRVQAQGKGGRCVAPETDPRGFDPALSSVVRVGEGEG